VDGHHSTDPEEEATYNGDSVARWDHDTLVVDVTRLTDDTWLADNGFLHSNKLHVVERLRRVGDTIQYAMTADDPTVLMKPWTITRTLTLQPDMLSEAAPCVDNDAGHYVNSEHHDNAR
jgi:aryl carrier-like protein